MKSSNQRPSSLNTSLRGDDMLGREKISRLLSGNLSSNTGGLFGGNIFDNCSPGSLIGSLKPFAEKPITTSNSFTTQMTSSGIRMVGEDDS